MPNRNIIQGVEVYDTIYQVGRKNKKFQAVLLSTIEQIIPKDSPEYVEIRKAVLDSFNKYTRHILTIIFGYDFN